MPAGGQRERGQPPELEPLLAVGQESALAVEDGHGHRGVGDHVAQLAPLALDGLLRALAPRDVARDGLEAHDLRPFGQELHVLADPDLVAAEGDGDELVVAGAHPVAELRLEALLHPGAVILADQLEEMLAQDLVRRPARHPRRHRVHVGEEPPHVGAIDDVLRVLDELPVAALAVAQPLGGDVQRRHVGKGDDHAVDAAVGADLGIGVDE